MNQNIPATLDLVQSLHTFESAVAKALALDDVQKWNGQTLKQQQEQIRQAALILAGQCISLLLYNLAQSREAHITAANLTQGWRLPSSIGHGKRKVQVLTLGNVVVSLWLPYVVERPPNPVRGERKKRKQPKRQGFYPFSRWLGMDEHITPLVWSTLAQYGMLSASFAAACDTLKVWGVTMSLKRIERLTYKFGHLGLFKRQQAVNQLRQRNLPTTPILKDQRVVISADSGRTRIRRAKIGKRRSTNRHGYYGDWTEPKLLTIYVVDEQGKRVNTASLPVTNDGTFAGVEQFMQLLEMHLVSLGISQAKQVLLLADGAEWIWLRLPALLQRLGCRTESIIELLDFYHATEHLQDFAEFGFTNPQAVQTWFKTARVNLKQGRIAELVNQMQAMVEKASGQSKHLMAVQLAYFTKGSNRGD